MNSSFLIVATTILVAVTERQLQHMAGFNDCNSKYTKLLPLLNPADLIVYYFSPGLFPIITIFKLLK